MFLISQARVTSHNPPNGLQVIFKSMGQSPSAPVTMLRDYADARRVSQRPLPQIGTWGLVLFPYGDLRNGVWLGSYYPSLMDALTTTQASGHAATDAFIDYEAHFSGDWQVLDGLGNFARQFADSSYVVVASGSALPTLYRHTVDQNNMQQTVAYPYPDRVTNPPSSFYFHIHHNSGADALIDPSGNVTISGGVSGIFTLKFGMSTFVLDTSGNASLTLAGSDTFSIAQSGHVASDAAVLVSKLLTAFNAHKHSGVNTGGGQTGVPVTALASGDINSTLVKLSG